MDLTLADSPIPTIPIIWLPFNRLMLQPISDKQRSGTGAGVTSQHKTA